MLMSHGGGDPSAMPNPFLSSSDRIPGFAFLTCNTQDHILLDAILVRSIA